MKDKVLHPEPKNFKVWIRFYGGEETVLTIRVIRANVQKVTVRKITVNIFNGLLKNKLSRSYPEFLTFYKYITKTFK